MDGSQTDDERKNGGLSREIASQIKDLGIFRENLDNCSPIFENFLREFNELKRIVKAQEESLKAFNEHSTHYCLQSHRFQLDFVECKREIDEAIISKEKCQRPECIKANQRVKYLEEELEKQREQLNKVTVMKQFEMQHDGKHDELGKEYEDLWTNVDVILEEIEKNFPEEKKFHAKIYLSHIFVKGYDSSKVYLNKLITLKLDQLHKVHEKLDPKIKTELESMSRVYGMLMHATGAVGEHIQKEAVTHICDEMRGYYRGKNGKDWIADLPLERVVKVGWKFLTQPCPIIVCQPPKFDKRLHRVNTHHWDDKLQDYELVYARPVVYRSYHGDILKRGYVGNRL